MKAVPGVARPTVASLVGLVLTAPPTTLHAAPRSPSASDGAAAVSSAPAAVTTSEEVHALVRRAELRREVGDDDGAIALLTDALEQSLEAHLPPRLQADIRLRLLEIHEGAGHREVADRIRAGLVRDRDLLELTDAEVERLRKASAPSTPAPTSMPATKPDGAPAPPTGTGGRSVVEEKVLESEVFSDRKMIGSGIGLVTVGLGFGLGGAVLLIYARSTENSLDEYEIPEQEDERNRAISDGTAENGAGIAFIAVGGVLVLTGCTLIGVGYARKRARLGKNTKTKAKTKQAQLVPSPLGLEVRF